MNKKTYTLAELVERSVPYFAANPDAPHLLATTHKGKFYLPEFESYAQHAVAKDGDGEVLVIDRELLLKPEGMSYADAFAEAGLVVPVEMPAAPTALAEAVARAGRFYFPEPAAPTSESKTVNITIDTRPVTAAIEATVKRVLASATAPAAEVSAKRAYKPRAPKPAAEAATESAPTTRKPRAPKPAAAQATATEKKASTKKTK